MTCAKFVKYLSIMCAFLLSTPAFSEPSPGIRTLIGTPASAFDVFLHQLYIASNGASYFGGPNMKEQLRIYNLDYDYDSDLIVMGFHIGKNHRLMKGFGSSDVENRKRIMLRAAKDIATSLGVEPRDGIVRIGLIQSIKIRNGWGTKDFSESQIKEEIAERTVLEIAYSWENNYMYKVRRTHSGRYEFSMDTK